MSATKTLCKRRHLLGAFLPYEVAGHAERVLIDRDHLLGLHTGVQIPTGWPRQAGTGQPPALSNGMPRDKKVQRALAPILTYSKFCSSCCRSRRQPTIYFRFLKNIFFVVQNMINSKKCSTSPVPHQQDGLHRRRQLAQIRPDQQRRLHDRPQRKVRPLLCDRQAGVAHLCLDAAGLCLPSNRICAPAVGGQLMPAHQASTAGNAGPLVVQFFLWLPSLLQCTHPIQAGKLRAKRWCVHLEHVGVIPAAGAGVLRQADVVVEAAQHRLRVGGDVAGRAPRVANLCACAARR